MAIRHPPTLPPLAAALGACLMLGAAALAVPGPARAEAPAEEPPAHPVLRGLRALKSNPLGQLYLTLNARYEFADINGLRDSHAFTTRIVPGFGSRSWKGFSILAEAEAIVVSDRDEYFDGTGDPNGRSVIPDPPDFGLNQAYLDWERPEWTTHLRLGRQRIVLDDARFIGNVAWRQNEQTFDAAGLETGFGRKDVQLSYRYVAQVLRPFGDRGPAATRDTDSRSHLVRALWKPDPGIQAIGFAYLLDLEGLPRFSSHTVGGRLVAERAWDEDWTLDGILSAAYQVDAADNPDDYRATYQWAQAGLARDGAGRAAVGFERLGSDDGNAVFLTPLATLHAHNGFADAFLDNGGPDGLRDLSLTLEPALPWRLEAAVILHHFWSDEGGDPLGWEIDGQVSRRVTPWASLLAKAAYFDRTRSAAPASRVRVWLQLRIDL